jgi:hypothetical protein
MNANEAIEKKEEKEGIICDDCDKLAGFRCRTCGKAFCEQCRAAHLSRKSCRGHTVEPLNPPNPPN